MKQASPILIAAVALAAARTTTTLAAAPSQPSPEVMRAFIGPWTGMGGTPEQQAGALAPPANPTNTVNDRRFPPALLAKLTPRSRAAYLKFKDLASRVGAKEVPKEPPIPDNNCLPFAIPGETITTGWPMTIMVTPKVVGILMQIDNQLRLVHMNQKHPENLKPTMLGHSVGAWEGDTLVIDTIGFDLRSQFNDGFVHGPNLHAVERYQVIDGGKTLEKTFTYTDPDALTEPYTWTRREYLMTGNPFQEYVNAQNNTLYDCPTAAGGSKYTPVE
jgi:hypothetical protein